MSKKDILEIIEFRELQLQEILNAPAPALPVLHQSNSRRKANATAFLKQLRELKFQLESLADTEIQYVQPHTFRQFLKTTDSYKYILDGDYCYLATVRNSSHGTMNLLAISTSNLL